jgi:hypothetical protein
MVSIPTKLKYFLIIIITFTIIYWFQMVDDKKRCKKRTNNYDKIKLPLLVSAMVGSVLLWNNDCFTTIFVSSNCNEISILERPMEISNCHSNLDIYTGLPEW